MKNINVPKNIKIQLVNTDTLELLDKNPRIIKDNC